MFPIDTWVKQISIELGLDSGSEDEYWVNRTMIQAARSAGVDPNRYNVGAWHVGKNQIDVSSVG